MTTTELFHKGQDFFIHGQLQESIETFTKAHDQGYNPARTYLSRGVSYFRAEEYDKAINDFSAVVALEPENERGYYYRGIAFLGKGEFAHALEDLDRSLSLNPQRAAAFLARALAKNELGRTEEAVSDFKAAVAYSNVETEHFTHSFGSYRTLFERSMALLEGERGPLTMVLTEDEIKKLERWVEK